MCPWISKAENSKNSAQDVKVFVIDSLVLSTVKTLFTVILHHCINRKHANILLFENS